MEAFELTPASKDMIQRIAALSGATKDDVKKVWEYTVFAMMLDLCDNDRKFDKLEIPYVGHLDFKLTGTVADANGKLKPQVEAYIVPEEGFEKLYAKIKKDGYGELSEYFQNNFIHKIANNIE